MAKVIKPASGLAFLATILVILPVSALDERNQERYKLPSVYRATHSELPVGDANLKKMEFEEFLIQIKELFERDEENRRLEPKEVPAPEVDSGRL